MIVQATPQQASRCRCCCYRSIQLVDSHRSGPTLLMMQLPACNALRSPTQRCSLPSPIHPPPQTYCQQQQAGNRCSDMMGRRSWDSVCCWRRWRRRASRGSSVARPPSCASATSPWCSRNWPSPAGLELLDSDIEVDSLLILAQAESALRDAVLVAPLLRWDVSGETSGLLVLAKVKVIAERKTCLELLCAQVRPGGPSRGGGGGGIMAFVQHVETTSVLTKACRLGRRGLYTAALLSSRETVSRSTLLVGTV
jgi:hypothetical protein